MSPRPGIIIPALNEGRQIGSVVTRALTHITTVIVVDDGSSDDTGSKAADAGAIVIRNERRLGKGRSLKIGSEKLLSSDLSHAIFMDGDAQHDADDIPAFLASVARGSLLTIGDRSTGSREMPLLRRSANRIMSKIVGKLCGQRIPDSQCGMRMIESRTLQKINTLSVCDHYDYETEMLLIANKLGIAIESIPIRTIYGSETSSIEPIDATVRWLRLIGYWITTNARSKM